MRINYGVLLRKNPLHTRFLSAKNGVFLIEIFNEAYKFNWLQMDSNDHVKYANRKGKCGDLMHTLLMLNKHTLDYDLDNLVFILSFSRVRI